MSEKPTYKELEQRVRELEEANFERRQMEDSLRDNRRLLADIIENSGTLIILKDCDGKYQLVNRKWEEVTGLNRESVLGKTDEMLFPANIARQFRENDLHVIESGSVIETEEFLETSSGIRYFISNKFPIVNDAGITTGMCGIITEITERKRAEDAVTKSESMQRKMVANIGDVIVIIDRDGINRYKSPNIEKLFGWKPEDVVGVSTWENIHPEDLEATQNFLGNLISVPNAMGTTECRYKCKDGSYKWIELTGSNLLDDPDINGILGNYHDVTDRKLAEQDLFESETRFKALHNASFGGIAIHDKGIILECNYGLSKISGYSVSELIGMNGLLLIAEKSRNAVMDNIVNDYEKPYEVMGLRKDGTEFPVRLEARIIPYKGKQVRTVEFRDITDQKQAEEERERLQSQLIQAQKMESVGRLAGGVAHDFNNMLGVILGYTELVMSKIGKSELIYNDLQEIYKAARRSTGITRQLLAFARQQTVAPKVLDLNYIISGMHKMLLRLIGEDIDLVWLPGVDVWPVKLDPSQIDQILANVCVNARDAITDVGKVIIETKNIRIDDAYCVNHAEFVPGEYVMLTVSDDGCGMGTGTLENVFEPFFTTKDVDKGTGLGLATVYGIVKQNNGLINVYSEPEKGTTFKIYFPRHEGQAGKKNKKEMVTPDAPGSETILLVEDEPGILKMTTVMLERLGYSVLVANTPDEATRLAREHAGEIHLLITDVIMPKMNGRDLSKNLMGLHSNLKCLFMSGYTANIIAQHGVLDKGVQFIQKPFAMKDLAVAVRKAMDENTP